MVKGLAAALVAMGVGFGVRWLVRGGPGSSAVGLAAIVAAYLAVVLALGLSREDVMVLRSADPPRWSTRPGRPRRPRRRAPVWAPAAGRWSRS